MPTTNEPTVYLTFDDGPHPKATPFVLDQLKAFNATGAFFCIGKNVTAHPDIYERIIAEGHTVGNHTHNHLNGWKTDDADYIDNIQKASEYINSTLFRPPYGRIKQSQIKSLQDNTSPPFSIYMWSILSGDFDIKITPQHCTDNVLKNIQPGHIIVFHDSEKAWDRMSYALPKVLEYCSSKNWLIKSLPKQQ